MFLSFTARHSETEETVKSSGLGKRREREKVAALGQKASDANSTLSEIRSAEYVHGLLSLSQNVLCTMFGKRSRFLSELTPRLERDREVDLRENNGFKR